MKKIKRPQIIVLGFAVFLIVLLLLLPRIPEKVPASVAEETPEADYKRPAISSLDDNAARLLEAIQAGIDAENDPLDKIGLYDSLSHFWENQQQLILAADALNEIANVLQDKPSYFIAGDKYFEAFQAENEPNKLTAIKMAIATYNKIVDANPDDLEAATSLGVCYVEGATVLGEPPMKGIQILRDVLVRDPKNVNAMINLGYFSIKSGQFDKAIERFEQVLKLRPEYTDAHLYLTDVYLKMGKTNKALEQLQRYKLFVKDPEALKQLEIYINKIKNTNV